MIDNMYFLNTIISDDVYPGVSRKPDMETPPDSVA